MEAGAEVVVVNLEVEKDAAGDVVVGSLVVPGVVVEVETHSLLAFLILELIKKCWFKNFSAFCCLIKIAIRDIPT